MYKGGCFKMTRACSMTRHCRPECLDNGRARPSLDTAHEVVVRVRVRVRRRVARALTPVSVPGGRLTPKNRILPSLFYFE